jgi:pimeloyl-ACP methyl ester carboxylesterase
LIWGRHDRQVRLGLAEAASARHGWPLHVIERAADDPAVEQPDAFLQAVRGALGSA